MTSSILGEALGACHDLLRLGMLLPKFVSEGSLALETLNPAIINRGLLGNLAISSLETLNLNPINQKRPRGGRWPLEPEFEGCAQLLGF